jgi:FAD binding domain of DNA photolyase
MYRMQMHCAIYTCTRAHCVMFSILQLSSSLLLVCYFYMCILVYSEVCMCSVISFTLLVAICYRINYYINRCYSPVAFGKKTDPTGAYIRKYMPQVIIMSYKHYMLSTTCSNHAHTVRYTTTACIPLQY